MDFFIGNQRNLEGNSKGKRELKFNVGLKEIQGSNQGDETDHEGLERTRRIGKKLLWICALQILNKSQLQTDAEAHSLTNKSLHVCDSKLVG